MFTALRAAARRRFLSGVQFCESCAQVCTADCRAEAHLARWRTEVAARTPHVF